MKHSPGNTGLIIGLARLVRLPNLIIIALTMMLVRYALLSSFFSLQGVGPAMPPWQFVLLAIASVFIAAAGYIINDLLDRDIDGINKPGRNLIGTIITEKAANTWYLMLNIAGIGLGIALSFLAGKIQLGILFILIATALYFYSYKYKYLAFWGNFTVSVLSAMVVIIVWLFEFFHLRKNPDAFTGAIPVFNTIVKLILSYSSFAFLLSMLREFIKDIRDIPGDTRYGCETIPVRIGLEKSRIYSLAATLLVIMAIGAAQYWLILEGFTRLSAAMLPTQLLLLSALFFLARARDPVDFAKPVAICRWAMVAGILTMIVAAL
jgi:4-hydroxybenzoate polyprenyltransferase